MNRGRAAPGVDSSRAPLGLGRGDKPRTWTWTWTRTRTLGAWPAGLGTNRTKRFCDRYGFRFV